MHTQGIPMQTQTFPVHTLVQTHNQTGMPIQTQAAQTVMIASTGAQSRFIQNPVICQQSPGPGFQGEYRGGCLNEQPVFEWLHRNAVYFDLFSLSSRQSSSHKCRASWRHLSSNQWPFNTSVFWPQQVKPSRLSQRPLQSTLCNSRCNKYL